ncbi:MAG: hypothetical protein M1822_008796 [Bathelium mastoideum]|nr:MAG: hypothetical protein M1822_008796 [Bathelium mastoideum]
MNGTNGSSKLDPVPTWIDAAPRPIAKDRLFDVISSKTGQVVHQAQSASVDEALAAAESSYKAWINGWKDELYEKRRDLLHRVADIYERRIAEFAQFQVEETSCAPEFAEFNVRYTVQHLRETASVLAAIRGSVPRTTDQNVFSVTIKEPIGPVMTIVPWNGALILSTRAVSNAIAAGCTVVLKASELCPRTHHAIVEAFTEAGCPPGVLNQIQCRRQEAAEVTEALIASPYIRKVEFIGSQGVGRIIGQICAKHLKPILMELGGKGPAIVLDDADLPKAAAMCAAGATLHHGQICFSTERIFVHRKIYEPFLQHLTKAFQDMQGAGYAVNVQGATHAYDFLKDAQDKGAKFLVGGPQYVDGDKTKARLRPSLLTNTTPEMLLWDDETFGPSASVFAFEDDAEVILKANDSKYGLNAAVHTTSWERGLRFSKALDYGQVQINGPTTFDRVSLPIGGVKGSGWGNANSSWGLEEFVVEKTVNFHATAGDASIFTAK